MRRLVKLALLLLIPLALAAHDVTDADQEVLSNGGLWAYIWVGAL